MAAMGGPDRLRETGDRRLTRNRRTQARVGAGGRARARGAVGGPVGGGQRLGRWRGRPTINRVLLKIPANFLLFVFNVRFPLLSPQIFCKNFGFTMVA